MWHLLLVMQNGLRIYVQFDQEQVQVPPFEDCAKNGAICDYLIEDRFKSNWQIAEIMTLPSEDAFLDQVNIDY